MAFANLLLTLGLPVLMAVGYGFYAVYQHRSRINGLRKQGIPMPAGWSWIWGHLFVLKKYADRVPPDAYVSLAVRDMAWDFVDSEMFLLDIWPVFPPLLMIFSPEVALQAIGKYNLPKTDRHLSFTKPITGGPNLLSMNGVEWKTWRSLFNPGFSVANMMDHVPGIIDSVQVFCDELRKRVDAGLFCLDELTTRLTMDVIIKVTLDTDLDYQRSENVLSTALNYITAWHSFWDPRILAHPFRLFVQKYYGRVMNTFIKKELDKRYFEMRKARDTLSSAPKRAKSVIALALEGYMANQEEKFLETAKLDDHFAKYATYQIRLFLFAGNDTTSSSIVYVYHMLSKKKDALIRIREEHDRIFGTDPSAAAGLLRENPTLLNQCPYTLAVIKETLRLFPPASTVRQGRSDLSLTDKQGNSYPLGHINPNILHQAIHVNPRLWPRATEFLPDRWLVDEGHELYPYPGAYRPFEQGPRSCIGQTLVYNEMRIVMVMTARLFDIKPAYDEWDAMKLRNEGLVKKIARYVGLCGYGGGIKTVHGERAYQTEKAGTHPADGYPCNVTLVK